MHLESQEIECSVCKDCFTEGENVICLPCNHLYHPDCILPWLKDVSNFFFNFVKNVLLIIFLLIEEYMSYL